MERCSKCGCYPDDPELDATDAAHHAWWRGQEYAVKIMCQFINEILDKKYIYGGISHEPWESTRKRLFDLVKEKEESK